MIPGAMRTVVKLLSLRLFSNTMAAEVIFSTIYSHCGVHFLWGNKIPITASFCIGWSLSLSIAIAASASLAEICWFLGAITQKVIIGSTSVALVAINIFL